jgi:hypothetical protein
VSDVIELRADPTSCGIGCIAVSAAGQLIASIADSCKKFRRRCLIDFVGRRKREEKCYG